jgi:hypothetical protein
LIVQIRATEGGRVRKADASKFAAQSQTQDVFGQSLIGQIRATEGGRFRKANASKFAAQSQTQDVFGQAVKRHIPRTMARLLFWSRRAIFL